MTKENEKKVDVEPEELVEPEEILDENGEDTTDWKALAQKNFGIAKRYKTKLDKKKEVEEKKEEAKPKEESKEKPQDKKEFDMAEKSYLLANGIKKNEFQLVWDEIKESGKSIDQVLESKYFQEKREMNATKEATPKDNKRGGGAAKDSASYWIQKGEYPPDTIENQEIRRKVAATLAKQSGDKSKFSSNPIV
ncbi:MAG: hypothetical protein U9O94_05195 [Nanoarchaeota archaeon]|nr:hypothetical protein [Nanoarchaeota archaeon]